MVRQTYDACEMTTLLAILGSLGGALLLWQFFKRGVVWVKVAGINCLTAQKDYRYSKVEVAERFVSKNQTMTVLRRAEIVSQTDYLRSIRIGTGPHSVAVITPRLIKGPATLRDIPAAPPTADWKDFSLDFDRPLMKGDSVYYELETKYDTRGDNKHPSRVSWMSTHRVDLLTLRVVFEKAPPDRVKLVVVNSYGETIKEEHREVDPISRECRATFKYPKPTLIYILTWETLLKELSA